MAFQFSNKASLKFKLLGFTLASCFIMAIASTLLLTKVFNDLEKTSKSNMTSYADNLEAAIAAQFFERYGDIQAFAINPGILSPKRETVVDYLNSYVTLYGIYDLILFVDPNGKLIATNNIGADGKPIDSKALYSKNFANESWFKKTLQGEYTEDKAKNFSGTYFEDPSFDSSIETAYGKPTFASSFSTQVKNKDGEIVGVISNRANFKWTEGEFLSVYKALKVSHLEHASLTLLAKDGTLLFNFDPSKSGNEEYQHNPELLLKHNWITDKRPGFAELSENKDGSTMATDPFENTEVIAAYQPVSHSKWIDSIGWKIIVQDRQEEVFGTLRSIQKMNYISIALLITIISIVSYYFSSSLARTVSKITESLSIEAEKVFKASSQITESSAQLSEASNTQASALQETAAAIDEVSAMIQKTASNADLSRQNSEANKEAATEGKNSVGEMLTAIQEIHASNEEIMNQVEASNREISDIVKVISEIGNKTKVINDIVFQTKLLSFNASVEAARAGEHGKGFAVVAEEVGNLAQMSGNAAKEISSMLEGSIQKVEGIVKNTKSRVESLLSAGKSKMERGTQTAEKCSAALQKILNSVNQLDQMIIEISTASSEQSTGMTEIGKATSQLDQVTTRNNGLANESSKQASDLQNQAQSLRGLVSELAKFSFGEDSSIAQSNPVSEPPLTLSKEGSTKSEKNTLNSDKPSTEKRGKHNVVSITRAQNKKSEQLHTTHAQPTQIAVNGGAIPSHSDPRFEDL